MASMATTEQRAAAWTAFRDEESKNVRWGLLCNLHSAKIETTDRKMQTAFGQLLWHLMDKLDNVDWLDEGTPPQQLYPVPDQSRCWPVQPLPYPQVYWGRPNQDQTATVKCEVIANRLLALTMHHNPTLRPPISYLNSRQPTSYFVNPVVVQDPTGQELARNKPHILTYLKLSPDQYDELEPYAGTRDDYKMVTAWARLLNPAIARVYYTTMRGFMHLARQEKLLSDRKGRYLGSDGSILPSDHLAQVLSLANRFRRGEMSIFSFYRPYHIMYAFAGTRRTKLVTLAELVEIMRAYCCEEEVAMRFAEYIFELMYSAVEDGRLDLAQVSAKLIQAEYNKTVDVARLPDLQPPTGDDLEGFGNGVTTAVAQTMQILADQVDTSVMIQAATEERRKVPPVPTTSRDCLIDALRLDVDDPELSHYFAQVAACSEENFETAKQLLKGYPASLYRSFIKEYCRLKSRHLPTIAVGPCVAKSRPFQTDRNQNVNEGHEMATLVGNSCDVGTIHQARTVDHPTKTLNDEVRLVVKEAFSELEQKVDVAVTGQKGLKAVAKQLEADVASYKLARVDTTSFIPPSLAPSFGSGSLTGSTDGFADTYEVPLDYPPLIFPTFTTHPAPTAPVSGTGLKRPLSAVNNEQEQMDSNDPKDLGQTGKRRKL